MSPGDTPLIVCIVTPLPPPYGGIANWSVMIRDYARGQTGMALQFVDVAPRYREVHDLAIWKRVVFGGVSMVWHTALMVLQIARGAEIVHIVTAGQLAIYRDLLMMYLCRGLRRPVVYHVRYGRIPQMAEANTREWKLIARAFRLADTVLVLDAATERTIFTRLNGVRVKRVPNCIDLATLPPVLQSTGQSPKRIVYLGWIIPAKGIEELVEAWAGLTVEGWELLIVGPGDVAYQRSLTERFAPRNLKFLPEVSHEAAMNLMASASMFVLPSHTEGFPNVVIEAMALGKPIIATEVGAIPEMLAGDCGVTVAPRNATALRQAIAGLIARDELRDAIGRNACDKARRQYALSAVFGELQLIWRQTATEN